VMPTRKVHHLPLMHWHRRAGSERSSLSTLRDEVQRRRVLSLPLLLGAGLCLAVVPAQDSAANFVAAGQVSHHSKLALAAKAPGIASMEKQPVRRLLDDIGSIVTSPYRLFLLSQITKQEVATLKDQRSKQGSVFGDSKGAAATLKTFLPTYVRSHVIARTQPRHFRNLLRTSLNVFADAITTKEPYQFEPYHKAVRGPPVDHYKWGNDFFRSMVKYRSLRVEGVEYVEDIKKTLAAGDNVVLLANHQTEADPQVLSILLELEGHEDLSEQTIFVAGHKVTTDRFAIPFSMGRNLLTILSKKYLDTFNETEREVKNARNQATVSEMQRLLKEGGHIIWVAPSGGRDRANRETGRFEPAKFDEKSVGLFYLLGQKAAKGNGPKTHFFPLAMWTHRLVPPPKDAKSGVGEHRSAARAPVGVQFGPKMDAEAMGGRKKFPLKVQEIVNELYDNLHSLMR